MIRNLLLFTIVLFFQTITMQTIASESERGSHILTENAFEGDSSNYSLKVIRKDMKVTHLIFSIVNQVNLPDDGMIFLHDQNDKPINGVILGNHGQATMLIWDERVKYIEVYYIGSYKVVIPIEKVKNKMVEIKVQLFPAPIN